MPSRLQIKIVVDDDDEDVLSREDDDALPSAEASGESRESAEELATTISPIPLTTTAETRAEASGPVVELTTGRIEGGRNTSTLMNHRVRFRKSHRQEPLEWIKYWERFSGIPAAEQTVHKFLGIPFAEPPLGDLRFRHPLPVKTWSPKIVQADTKPFPCLQGPFYINRSQSSMSARMLNILPNDGI